MYTVHFIIYLQYMFMHLYVYIFALFFLPVYQVYMKCFLLAVNPTIYERPETTVSALLFHLSQTVCVCVSVCVSECE